ncbi:hypothetical protein BKA70DRAFT_1271386 [Coprinopsis sp. MPI-PUGE-AT-0042]|nr:hypothetical protein BKA70DRAFT_1271386 [Coprinopsis sp. MPI-PUGE-AT-0042]
MSLRATNRSHPPQKRRRLGSSYTSDSEVSISHSELVTDSTSSSESSSGEEYALKVRRGLKRSRQTSEDSEPGHERIKSLRSRKCMVVVPTVIVANQRPNGPDGVHGKVMRAKARNEVPKEEPFRLTHRGDRSYRSRNMTGVEPSYVNLESCPTPANPAVQATPSRIPPSLRQATPSASSPALAQSSSSLTSEAELLKATVVDEQTSPPKSSVRRSRRLMKAAEFDIVKQEVGTQGSSATEPIAMSQRSWKPLYPSLTRRLEERFRIDEENARARQHQLRTATSAQRKASTIVSSYHLIAQHYTR